MKKTNYTILSLFAVTSVFFACSSDADSFFASDNLVIEDNLIINDYEYIDLSEPMTQEVKSYRVSEAEKRIVDNLKIVDGKFSLEHTSAEELRIDKDYFDAMKYLLERAENPYEVIVPKAQATTLTTGEPETGEETIGRDAVADIILALLDSQFEKKCFTNYWYSGNDLVLEEHEWKDIKEHAEKKNKAYYPELERVEISFYDNDEYDRALGNASVYFLRNNAVGFYDYYNFDPKEWFERDIDAEVLTRIINTLGGIYDGKAYNITFGIRE